MKTVEKKNDFSAPTRQSNLALILLVWKYFRIVVRQSWPVLIVAFLGKNSKFDVNYAIYVFIGIVAVSFVLSIVAFFRFYFFIKDQNLYIQKGIFKTTNTHIPFDRIQSINFDQNLLLRATNHVKLEIETAGSSKTEMSINALELSVAEELRNTILHNSASKSQTDKLEVAEQQEQNQLIFSLTPFELLKIGITENHLRSFFWILGIAAYVFSNLEDIGLDVYDILAKNKSAFAIGAVATITVACVALLGLVLISMIRIFLKYYDLSMWRIENGFKFYMGLINHREKTTPFQKIQMLKWGDNPLKRLFGIWRLWIYQAESSSSKQSKSFNIPIGNFEQIDTTLSDLYSPDALDNMEAYSIHHKFFIRRLTYLLILMMASSAVFIYFQQWVALAFAVFICIYWIVTSYIRYKKAKYSFNLDFLLVKKGIFGNEFSVIPWFKSQAVSIDQNFYQKRNQLANVTIYAASGSIVIPYIPLHLAQQLVNYSLYKVESSSTKWM